ncbi:hypothetical protein [Robbsia andropogonis]|uniref:hypothetical protein n=1 Tax=Robbsia andropogonis TaxID=28092 RepID=UPI0020A08132|nr:hypothetical protein [Robbsia andropogonis]MCP1121100.1 hypothetical protein [Robbsia andropogonis]MCP1130900.1 hypothetical protein [Robbsia andropogonis]
MQRRELAPTSASLSLTQASRRCVQGEVDDVSANVDGPALSRVAVAHSRPGAMSSVLGRIGQWVIASGRIGTHAQGESASAPEGVGHLSAYACSVPIHHRKVSWIERRLARLPHASRLAADIEPLKAFNDRSRSWSATTAFTLIPVNKVRNALRTTGVPQSGRAAHVMTTPLDHDHFRSQVSRVRQYADMLIRPPGEACAGDVAESMRLSEQQRHNLISLSRFASYIDDAFRAKGKPNERFFALVRKEDIGFPGRPIYAVAYTEYVPGEDDLVIKAVAAHPFTHFSPGTTSADIDALLQRNMGAHEWETYFDNDEHLNVLGADFRLRNIAGYSSLQSVVASMRDHTIRSITAHPVNPRTNHTASRLGMNATEQAPAP